MNRGWNCAFVGIAILLSSSCAIDPPVHQTRAASDSPLRFMFGEWSGTASGVGFDGKPFEVMQTERVGPMLGGDVTVIEGRGYDTAGELVFNAFAIVSYDKRRNKWEIRSYTSGFAGTYPFEPTENGYVWSTPAGPGASLRFTASFDGDTWHQIGEYIPESGPSRKTFEMNLKRTGPTSWPAAGIVTPTEDAS